MKLIICTSFGTRK